MTRWIAASLLLTVLTPLRAHATLHSGRQVVSGFHSNDDGFDHAIVLESNGDIREIYFLDHQFVSTTVLRNYSDAFAIAAFYTDYDHFRHVIVARTSGEVDEVYWGSFGVSGGPLGHFLAGTLTGVAGWVDNNSIYHAAVSLTTGAVNYLPYGPLVSNPVWKNIWNVDSGFSITDISGFADANAERIVVQTSEFASLFPVVQWYEGASPSVGYLSQTSPPPGCDISTATNLSATSVGLSSEYLAWGTPADATCWYGFRTPFTNTQSPVPVDVLTALTPVQSVGAFARPSSNGNFLVPHVITAYTNGAVYDEWSGDHYYLGQY